MSTYTQKERDGLYELTDAARAELTSSKYYNEDLQPTSIAQRTWTTYNITALWIGMCICIPSLSLASAAIALGLSPWLAVLNVILGNVIILIPMQLNSHAGTKYGIPFPVFARLTFGSVGAHVPTILRGLVACGWTSVQAWVGGGAVAALIGIAIPFFKNTDVTVALPGNPAVVVGQLIGFFLFMIFVLWVAYNGFENIKWVQNIGSPILVVVIALLFVWSAAQVVGAYFAQATKLTMGEAMFDPTNVFYHVSNPFLIFICSVGVIVATITTCVAANVVAPANGFSNLSPKRISYKKGVVITCILACFVFQPWWIYGSGAAYIFTWLNNYGIILAPVAAIFVSDYYICKKRRIDVAALFAGNQGRYWYKGGVNWAAIIAWFAAFILPLLGNTVFLYSGGPLTLMDHIAANGYIFSFFVGLIVYMLLMKAPAFAMNSYIDADEEAAMTER